MLVLLFFLVFGARAQTPNDKPSFIKHVSHAGQDFLYDYSIGDNYTFTYALCDRISTPHATRTCTLVQEVTHPGGSSHRRSCTTQLTVKKKYQPTRNKYVLAQLGQKDVVLAWNHGETKRNRQYTVCGKKKEFIKVRVMNMLTCQSREARLTADVRHDVFDSQDTAVDKNKLSSLNIITFSDGNMELVFPNEKLCGKFVRCTLKYESEAEEFGEDETIVPLLAISCEESAKIDPLLTSDSKLVGYVVEKSLLRYRIVNLLHPVGEIMLNQMYSNSVFNLRHRTSNLAVSHEEASLGICSQAMFASNVSCTRFDAEGKITLDLTVIIKSENVGMMKMRNHEGGILLLIGYVHSRIKGFEELDMVRIDSEGGIREYKSRKWFTCRNNEVIGDMDFFLRTGYRFCYYVTCTCPKVNASHSYHVKVYDRCFTEES